jgi:transcriptional regulator with XRE-family HTH domain
MGRTPREQPARLAEKLVHIRNALNLSQEEIVRRLGLEDRLTREEISKYERGLRTPSLLTLLKYARAAGLIIDDLIDDEIDLPKEIPVGPYTRASQVKSQAVSSRKKKPSKSHSRTS